MKIFNKFLKHFLTIILLTAGFQSINAQLLEQYEPRPLGTVVEQLEQSNLFKSQDDIVTDLLEFAMRHQGKPYRHGATGPNAFDCSGFTFYVFKQYGITLPHSAHAQHQLGDGVERGDEQPGDLVFFGGKKNSGGRIGHVGIVVASTDDGFNFIHASCSRGIMINHSQEKYYKARYRGAKRII